MALIIEKIILKNYRCYKDITIDTTKENLDLGNPGIALFTGDNAVGKTSLFNAIGWALYSRETQAILRRDPSTLPIPYSSSFDENGSSEVRVELHMKDMGSIKKGVLTRTATFKRNVATPIAQELTLFLEYNDNVDPNYLSSKNNNDTVQRFLKQYFPSDMAQFHLFDGEFLQFTYTNKGENIVTGIRNMFRIHRIEELRDAAKEVEEKYGKDRSKFTDNAKIQVKIEEQASWEEKKREIIKKTLEMNEEIKKNSDRNVIIDDELEKLGNVEAIKDKVDRVTKLDGKIKENSESMNKAVNTKISLILKNAYIINSKDNFNNVLKVVNELTERGKLPPEIKDTFVKDLMQRGLCICGTPLTYGDVHWGAMQKLLEEIAGSSDKEVLQDMYYSMRNAISNIETIKEHVYQENSNYNRLRKENNDLEEERSKLMEELQGVTSQEEIVNRYSVLKDERGKNRDSINHLNVVIGKFESEKKRAEEKIEEIGGEIEKFQEKNNTFKLYESYYKKAQKLRMIFSNIIENIISEIAERYQNEVNKMIKAIPLLSQFTVKISVSQSDYGKMDFEFLQDGNKKFYMAGGQNQLMGILLIAAFTKVIKQSKSEDISAPFVVIDNPVSTLSKDNIILFGKSVSDLFDGIHLILFTKNTDYGDIINGAPDNISRFYKLGKNQTDGSTIIEEVRLHES